MIHKSRKEIMSNKKRFFSYLNKQKKNVVLIILFSLLFVVAQISQPFLIGRALDFAKNNDDQSFYIYLCLFVDSCSLQLSGAVDMKVSG